MNEDQPITKGVITFLGILLIFVLGVNAVRGCGSVQRDVDAVRDVRVERVDEKSWTLVYEMEDGSERVLVTVQGMVVAAEKR